MDGNTILKMENIHKEFPGVVALDNINFDLKKGEIHALLGENGAGKSTLIKILGGIYQPDGGDIYVENQKVKIEAVQDARKLGISVIHQELCLAENMTVTENIFLGRMEKNSLGLVRDKCMNDKARNIMQTFGLEDIEPTIKVGKLTTAQQQMVEIAKALSMEAKIIVMDEPTSSLSEKEVEKLFDFIHVLKEREISIIYISHRLEEIYKICDVITVIRDGKYIASMPVKGTSEDTLMSLMVGRDLSDVYPERSWNQGKTIFAVKNLSGSGKIKNVNFELHEKEILGFYGLVGSGRTEVMRMLFGVDPIETGEICMDGKVLQIHCPEDAIKAGIALSPESRKDQGLVLIQNIDYNVTISIIKELIRGFRLDKKKNDQIVRDYCTRLRVKTPSYEQKVKNLSGGNQQKVVLAKWLATKPKVLILDEPTRGIDVGAKQEIYHLIKELSETGIGVLFISSELPEIVQLSHRVVVMREGEQVVILGKDHIDQEEIIKYVMGGAK